MSRDLIWNEADNSLYASGNPYRSFEAVRDGVFAPTSRDFEPFRCELEQLLDAGDFVIGTGRYRGISKETGKELSAQFCHVMHLDGVGQLDRVQEYTDTLAEAVVTGRAQMMQEQKIPLPAM